MRRLSSLWVCLLATSAVWADEENSLARLLPAETPVFIEARTPPPAELQQMAMTRMLADPRLKDLLERVGDDDDSVSSMRVPLGKAGLFVKSNMADPNLAIGLKYVDPKGERRFKIHNGMSLAWVGLLNGDFPIDAVAALQVDTDPKEAVETIRRIAAAVSLHVRDIEDGDIDAELKRLFTNASHKDVAYASARLGPVKLCLAPVGKLVVLTTSEARLKDLIDRQLDGSRPSLASTERHKKTLANAPGTGTATTVIEINVDRALATLQTKYPAVSGQIQGWLAMVGLGKLESVTTVARVDGEGVSATTTVTIPGARRGLGLLFAPGKPASYGCLKFAPKETLYVNCGNFDAASLYEICLQTGGMPVAMAQSKFEQVFGVKLRDELINLIGPEAAVIVAPNKGLIPDVAIVCESPDATKLEASLLKVLDGVPWPAGTGVRSFRMGAGRVHSVPLGHDGLARMPLAPTFGVVDGKLLVTLSPLSFQRMLAVAQGKRPSIVANRDFASLRERVPADALGLSYLDLRRVLEIVYETAIPLLQAMPQQPRTPLFEMPEVDVLTKYMFGRVAWRTADEKGLQWRSYSSLDTSGFVVGMAAAGGAAFFVTTKALEARQEAPPPVKPGTPKVAPAPGRDVRTCKYRVRLLRARLRLYQHEHNKLPASLNELKAEHVAAETFDCPGTKEQYVYLGPKGRGGVLLHGHPNGPRGGICILTKKMDIERISAQELKRRLER